MSQKQNISVIGAGPAGLMGAEILATAGHAVTVYDRMPSPGRKFLMAGRGGLNLTHSEPLENFLRRYGDASDWMSPSIRAFPPQDVIAWCEGLGEKTFIGSSGRVFPKSMKAAPLLRAWLKRLEKLGVRYAARHRWLGWQKEALLFRDSEGNDVTVTPDATLLALGGASWPRLGSNGDWVRLLEGKNIAMAPLKPANAGFTVPWSEHFSQKFAGQPLKPVTLNHGEMAQQGEAMITAQGLEGGVIYALSHPLRRAIETQGHAVIQLDLRPGMTMEALERKLQAAPRGSKSFSTYLQKAGFSPLIGGLLREVYSAEQLNAASPSQLAGWLKALPLTLTASAGLERAISTAGGIRRDAVDDHFMLLNLPGIYVAGEMLDWEAPTGGYLLQACFSTAVAAAKGISAY